MTEDLPPPLPIVPTVLLLEDNEAYRTLLAEVFTVSGYEVITAPNGRRVAEIFQQRRIDLVITDVAMPERDGIETMTELRYNYPRVPVIAISGDVPLNTHLFLTLAEKLGAFRVLAKPFKPTELLAAARDALAASGAKSETPIMR